MSDIRKLNQPTTFAGLSGRVEEAIEQAYWEMKAKQDRTQEPKGHSMSERDAFKWAVREMFKSLRSDNDQ